MVNQHHVRQVVIVEDGQGLLCPAGDHLHRNRLGQVERCYPANHRTRPVRACPVCETATWYERTAARGGGWCCGTCHPRPEDCQRKGGA